MDKIVHASYMSERKETPLTCTIEECVLTDVHIQVTHTITRDKDGVQVYTHTALVDHLGRPVHRSGAISIDGPSELFPAPSPPKMSSLEMTKTIVSVPIPVEPVKLQLDRVIIHYVWKIAEGTVFKRRTTGFTVAKCLRCQIKLTRDEGYDCMGCHRQTCSKCSVIEEKELGLWGGDIELCMECDRDEKRSHRN